MQCGIEKKTTRRQEVEVECFKCGKRGHKYKECLLWKKEEKGVERVAHMAISQKA